MPHIRGRAWRRRIRACKNSQVRRSFKIQCGWPNRQKRWKLMYLRSAKLRRARQIGLVWPYREWDRLMDDVAINVLFVCSRNQWRSPTAEHVWRDEPGINVRSAGTASSARRRIGLADIRWADLILVMEEKHKSRIKADFRRLVAHKRIEVLDIPDEYRFMDEELVAILRDKCAAVFERVAEKIN